jgi:PQQ-dependent catabolism-associated CXXCW motif protein
MRPLRQAHPTLWRRSTLRIAIVLACLCIALPDSRAQPPAEAHLDPATGYRIANYRAPTPKTVPGGTTITLEDLERLVAQQAAILLDVMPSDGIGPDPATGIWHTPKPRDHMRGSVWLPDVGKGTLTPALEAYFKTQLAKLTASNLTRPIILYCQADCWMSWNAVKRAASYGYTALYWYPDGTDGMRDFDVPLVRATPVSLPPAPAAQ